MRLKDNRKVLQNSGADTQNMFAFRDNTSLNTLAGPSNEMNEQKKTYLSLAMQRCQQIFNRWVIGINTRKL